MAKNPYLTVAERRRLESVIRPMESLEDMMAAFPQWALNPMNGEPDMFEAQRQFDIMRECPTDRVDGILGRRCHVCGDLTAHGTHMGGYSVSSLRLCWNCTCEMKSLERTGQNWNGLTVKGQGVLYQIMRKEQRIPPSSELMGYERKRRLGRRG